MKRETVIGIVLLALFVLAMALGGEVAYWVMYMLGCWMVGWNIPAASAAIEKILFKEPV